MLTIKNLRLKFSVLLLGLVLIAPAAAQPASVCLKYPAGQVRGNGPLPYNFRVIDRQIYAGGHPLNPATAFGNSDRQTLAVLNYLKSRGVRTVIDLENTKKIQKRYKSLLEQAGLKLVHIPMTGEKTPDAAEWAEIKEALSSPVYIHCKWGADRTGIVIARYLVEAKGYTAAAALRAVSTGGSHAGALGGLKNSMRTPGFLGFLSGKNN